jgi:4-carboxymuconolactone decarboxylase
MNTSYDRGSAVRREVLGDNYVEQAGARTTDFTRDFQALVTEFAWAQSGHVPAWAGAVVR